MKAVEILPRRALLGLALLLTAALPRTLLAQQPIPEDRRPTTRHPQAVEAIERLKSPYCPGFMLEVCTSAGGAALRDSIETLAEEGWTADNIVSWVLANHGDTLLALPPAQGKGLVAWLVPPLAVAVGLALVILALGRMRRDQPKVGLSGDLTPEQKRELDEALKELDAEEKTPLF
jgi:cytochrome c-type biogenesis protein CcmH/NrfF